MFTLIEAVAVARVLLLDPPRRPRLPAALLVAAMGLWYSATVWLDGSAVTSAINQDARFALLFLLAFCSRSPGARASWHGSSSPSGDARGVHGLALIGAYLAGTGQGQAQSG